MYTKVVKFIVCIVQVLRACIKVFSHCSALVDPLAGETSLPSRGKTILTPHRNSRPQATAAVIIYPLHTHTHGCPAIVLPQECDYLMVRSVQSIVPPKAGCTVVLCTHSNKHDLWFPLTYITRIPCLFSWSEWSSGVLSPWRRALGPLMGTNGGELTLHVDWGLLIYQCVSVRLFICCLVVVRSSNVDGFSFSCFDESIS